MGIESFKGTNNEACKPKKKEKSQSLNPRKSNIETKKSYKTTHYWVTLIVI